MEREERSVGLADFFHEAGQLKRTPRSGWAFARPASRESVADHSFRTAVIAMALAAVAGADPDLAATIALLHDLPESRLGDIQHLARRYLGAPAPFDRVVQDQTERLPPAVAEVIRDRCGRWLSGATTEAALARDADVLDAVLHVREVLPDRPALRDRWVDYLAGSLRTDTGRSALAEILATDPDEWWPRALLDG